MNPDLTLAVRSEYFWFVARVTDRSTLDELSTFQLLLCVTGVALVIVGDGEPVLPTLPGGRISMDDLMSATRRASSSSTTSGWLSWRSTAASSYPRPPG